MAPDFVTSENVCHISGLTTPPASKTDAVAELADIAVRGVATLE